MKNQYKTSIYSLALGLVSLSGLAQENSRWQDYFAYNNIEAIHKVGNEVLAATTSGLFYYNPSAQSYRKMSKVHGLHETNLSAFDINNATGKMLIGYQSGNLDVVENGKVSYVLDVSRFQSFVGDKNINHINIKDNLALLSANYGFSIFDLDRKEFKDSAIFKENNLEVAVKKAVFYQDKIYIITNKGLYSHKYDDKIGIYSTWKQEMPGNFLALSVGNTVNVGTETAVFRLNTAGTFDQLSGTFAKIKDLRATGEDLVVSEATKVQYFKAGVFQKNIDYATGINLNTANIIDGSLYAGSTDAGMIDEAKTQRLPDGPYNNKTSKISLLNGQIWACYGARADYNGGILGTLGYYHFDGKQWQYPEMFKQGNAFNILEVKPNPKDPSTVYFTNYTPGGGGSSVYKMQNNNLAKRYGVPANTNSTFFTNFTSIAFDESGQLFVSYGLHEPNIFVGLGVYNAKTDYFDLKPTVFGGTASNFINIKDGVILIPGPRAGGGLICYNYNNTPNNYGDDSIRLINDVNGLASDESLCTAIDKDNKVWIGTGKGLRYINFNDLKNEPNSKAKYVVIMQDNKPEELFKDLEIQSIAIDAANNKWLTISGGGVYQLNPDGEKTLNNFTTANSPLPSNKVTDIKIDESTGKIYFATINGMVSYQSDIKTLTKDFGELVAYPNPVVTSTYKGGIHFKGLAEKTHIRIVDVAGNLVHQAVSETGVYEWDLTIATGDKLASGIYFALMTNADGSSSSKVKFAVIN